MTLPSLKDLFVCLLPLFLAACNMTPWNNPYPESDDGKNILYSSFTERPKHLDPAQSYSANELAIIAQIYEPPLQYHYLKRPYTLIPFGAAEMPRLAYFDKQGKRLPDTADDSIIDSSVYEIHIPPGVLYQPHPAFARDQNGKLIYQGMTADDLAHFQVLSDFKQTGSRELVAEDFVHEIKRLAHPKLHSPIFGVMSDYIVGLKAYANTLQKAQDALVAKEGRNAYLDLSQYPLEGVEVVDRYTYRLKIKGKYPQMAYWLAMPFFAPVPEEADRFYSQPGMVEKNFSLDWYPVGTGPYMLTVNNPNRQMVLERNPNFHGERYPVEGEPGDETAGLLQDAGKPMPFIDKVIFSLEKESIPYWNKFLQGYYDLSGISSDSFDQAVVVNAQGEPTVTDSMKKKNIRLLTSVSTSTNYMGFNMLDSVVGGASDQARKLRQAISIAVDYEEFVSIFANGRGIPAQSLIPPGIFGYKGGKEGINPYVYDWVNGAPKRKSIEEAKRLLAEAGYADGRDAKTGKPLLLNLDTTGSGPDFKARLDWLRKQFMKLNLQLQIRSTDYNRFQDKIRSGNAQIFYWGWNADYPDPENFMFLLHGPNSRVGKEGENSANYNNPEYNRLFEQMKTMENGDKRQSIIDEMLKIARYDAPWLWGYHPKEYGLYHAWMHNVKPNHMANNGLKYERIDAKLRSQKQREWNQPVLWPLAGMFLLLFVVIVPAVIAYRRREKMVAR
ncbi:ABC transporter substrate-binding protein [Sulfurirhabdus autotrophica]|uniref:ABC-type transport system substrate-binding protein n=1 Tax=Sulfurirhabdus autotrophica TaxID=1706046 RepID=A0A4R3Y8T4_9PROT|nr:ABC transporter substrate-binding protein [Sulfurirhabdus autotrophica]TCV87358.1 ABC-type transport system substrate-binding protein [Sulfurirhabdus autotrophica]